ncbi:hemolysin family protein [Spirochaetota bacterium]
MSFDVYIIYEVSVFILILLSAFFSGSEISLVSSNRITLETYARTGNKRARRALGIIDNIEDAIVMILIGNNIANIMATAFITFIATMAFSMKEGEIVIVTIIQTVVFLILCEVSPKVVAKAKAEKFLMFFSLPLKALIIILKPLVNISVMILNVLKKLLNMRERNQSLVTSRDEINYFFQLGEKTGAIDEENQFYVSEILSFRKITAMEVMTPTIDIVSIKTDETINELVMLIDETRFSRIPVYEERVDNITGYIFYRDIMKDVNVKNVSDIFIHKPLYVPATKNIYELYKDLQEATVHMAFVVNEHGAVIGLITPEDIAEEVVGEIQTGDHEMEDLITRVDEKKYLVNGSLDIEYFQRKFSVDIEKKGFETVAGFITYLMGKIPKIGEKIKYGGITFIVDDATDRSVEKVFILIQSRKKKKKE